MERNDPCHCGSGRKYKKCCLAKDEAETANRLAEAKRQAEAKAEEERRAREEELAAYQRARESVPIGAPVDDNTAATRKPGLPPLSAEDQALVDAWWAEVSPVYMGRGGLDRAEWLLERTVAFLDEQPKLFRHLEVHDEFLLEVGPALNRAGLTAKHHALLLRLRDEQPEVYAECFGYWDYELLFEALRADCRADIAACLTRFRQEPVRFIDEFAQVVDLLAWHGCESELCGLLEPTAEMIYESDEVIDGGFGMQWLAKLAMFPVLELGDPSAESLEKLVERVMAVGYLKDNRDNREWLRRGALMAMPTDLEAGLNLDKAHSVRFDGDVAWSFAGWLRRTKGIAWSSARFLADAILNYWGWIGDAHKGTKPAGRKSSKASGKANSPGTFGLDGDLLREFLNEYCRDFYGIRVLTAGSSIQAFHYFSEYLAARGRLDSARAAQLQGCCEGDFEHIRKMVGAESPIYRIYPTFAALTGANTSYGKPQR